MFAQAQVSTEFALMTSKKKSVGSSPVTARSASADPMPPVPPSTPIPPFR